MDSYEPSGDSWEIDQSPLEMFLEGCDQGELRYQITPDGEPVFFPRLAAPGTGSELRWATSAGIGTVYASTTVRPSGGEPYNVVLVDIDEGFRIMSTVLGPGNQDVEIGRRVRAVMEDVDGEVRPVFVTES